MYKNIQKYNGQDKNVEMFTICYKFGTTKHNSVYNLQFTVYSLQFTVYTQRSVLEIKFNSNEKQNFLKVYFSPKINEELNFTEDLQNSWYVYCL